MGQGLRGYQELIANLVPLTGAARSKDLVPYMTVRHFCKFTCAHTQGVFCTVWSTLLQSNEGWLSLAYFKLCML